MPKQREQEIYDGLTNIRVSFQKNAWADEQFCQEDILNVAADIEAAGLGQKEILIGMDNHGAQRTDSILKLYEELGMIPLFTAANCTDCISPVDHHIGRHIQKYMSRCYAAEVAANPGIWIASSEDQEIEDANSSSAMERRILMAQWLSKAWEDLTVDHSNMISSWAFVDTGFLVAQDGSEDH